MDNNERFRVRRVTDGTYLRTEIYNDGRASLMWSRSARLAPVWTREQAHAMARAVSLIWGVEMSFEIEPAIEGGNDAATQ